jgi:hypothetical protein
MAGALRGSAFAISSSLYAARVVLGLRVVVEVEHAALVDRDVLEHGAEAVHGLPDLGLGRLRERIVLA